MSTIKLKICGVKSVEEARQLRACGVDLIGLNFIPSSTRYIPIETAQAILAELQDSGIQSAALFANKPLDDVNDYVRRLQVDYVQLHGNESADYAEDVNAAIIRAIAVDPSQSAASLIGFINKFPADYFVIDRFQQGRGDPVDLRLASKIIAAKPGQIFLAGGLTPENLAASLAQTKPYGVDIASGVRDENGALDIAKAKLCLRIVHAAKTSPA